MRSYKKLLIFSLTPMIFWFFGTSYVVAENIVETLDLPTISKMAYYECGTKLENNSSYLTPGSEEDMILEYPSIDMAQCVSDYEKLVLEKKRSLFKIENASNRAIATQSGSFRYKEKQLTYGEKKRLAENSMGLNCGGEGDINGTCMIDLRLSRYELTKNSSKLSKWTGNFGVEWTLKTQGWTNSLIASVDDWFGLFAFGFREFDVLPYLGYSGDDMFNTKTVIGAINSFVLILLAFLIVFYFLKRTTEREGDDYKVFFIKIGIILIVTIGFPSIYNSINDAMIGMNQNIIDTISKGGISDIKIESISMDNFGNLSFATLSGWWPVVFINLIFLFIISIVIVIRNIFLFLVGYLFFLTSIGLIIGTIRKDNIMEATDIVGKTGKFLTEGLFFSLSLFLSVAISVFLFKITTIIFGTFPSIEDNTRNMINGIGSLGVDTFFYFFVLAGIIFVWKKYIINITFSVVSKNFKQLLFNDNSGGLHTRDFFAGISNAYDSIKTNYEDQQENNPNFIAAQRKLGGIIDTTTDSIGTFVQNNTALQGLARLPGVEGVIDLFGSAGSVISDETSALRRGLKTAVSYGTGIGSTGSVSKEDVKIFGFDTGIKGERTKILNKMDARIGEMESKLTGNEDIDRKFQTQIQQAKERRQAIFDERGDEADVQSIQKNHAEILKYEKAIIEEQDPKKKEQLQYKMEELLYKKKHGYENLDQRASKQYLSEVDKEIKKVTIMREQGTESLLIDDVIGIDEELQGLRAMRGDINNNLQSGEAKRKKELSEIELTKLEYEKTLLKDKGLQTTEKEVQIQETEKEHIQDRVAYLEKEKERLLTETERHEAIDHDIGAIRQYKEERYGSDIVTPPELSAGIAPIPMELPPQLADLAKSNITSITSEEQPKITRDDENIIRFIERYGKYRESAVNAGEKDNISMFGDDPIVGDILSNHFSETGDIKGIGEKIDEVFRKFSNENTDGRIRT